MSRCYEAISSISDNFIVLAIFNNTYQKFKYDSCLDKSSCTTS